MRVLDDFDDSDREAYSKLSKTEGLLKIGVDRTFKIEDGKIMTFGSDPLCDFVIPLGDQIDEHQFAL